MKHLLVIMFLLLGKVSAQQRIIVDTSNLKQDFYFCYFNLPGDTSVHFKDYKYQYKYKRLNRKSVNKVFKFNGCKASIKANKDSLSMVLLSDCGPRYFKFILWLEDVIYIVHIDGWTVTRICKIDETLNGAGCREMP